jgi:hypothetical protein
VSIIVRAGRGGPVGRRVVAIAVRIEIDLRRDPSAQPMAGPARSCLHIPSAHRQDFDVAEVEVLDDQSDEDDCEQTRKYVCIFRLFWLSTLNPPRPPWSEPTPSTGSAAMRARQAKAQPIQSGQEAHARFRAPASDPRRPSPDLGVLALGYWPWGYWPWGYWPWGIGLEGLACVLWSMAACYEGHLS